MCGIAGIIDFRGRPVDEKVLRRMQGVLAHRGPDDAGLWTHASPGFAVGLVHTRLAVLDPTPAGHQPMIAGQGRWAVTYNGELYNFRELGRQLEVPLRSACDTEVVLQQCIAGGPEALNRFDGMWALAFVDAERRCGHLSRDPIGIKPLYYACHEGRLVFASEMRAIRCAAGLAGGIDREALGLYLLLGYIPHPWTIDRGVRKLAPGHRLDFDASGPREPVPFVRGPARPVPPKDYGDACRLVRRTIEEAVVRQTVADVPVGAFLSGGLDSAVVAAALTRGGGGVHTFSIGYADHPRYDETRFAERVAAHLGTVHRTFRVSFADVLALVEPLVDHLGEPFADSSLLPVALVSRQTRRHATVALSGDGGDELFGGYWRYLGHAYLARYHRVPGVLRRHVIEPLLGRAPDARSTRLLDRLRQVRKLLRGDRADPLERHLAWSRILDEPWADRLLGPVAAAAASDALKDLIVRAAGAAPGGEALEAILRADRAVGLPADMLHKVDLASMYYGLEVRVPLLSPDVVALAASLPLAYKMAGTTTKRVLRDAFRDALPAPVVQRRKMGFEVPVGEFLRRELEPMYRQLVTPAALSDLGLEPGAAADLYARHLARRQDHAEILWALLVLCAWHRRGGAGADSPPGPATAAP